MLEHERRLEPEDPIAEASELVNPPCVRTAAARMVKAVHLHHEPFRGGDEIDDEASADDRLPTEPRSGAASLDVAPKSSFARSE
jgi:hypothetical protein